jgi:hypothetical protein
MPERLMAEIELMAANPKGMKNPAPASVHVWRASRVPGTPLHRLGQALVKRRDSQSR